MQIFDGAAPADPSTPRRVWFSWLAAMQSKPDSEAADCPERVAAKQATRHEASSAEVAPALDWLRAIKTVVT